MYLRFLFVLLGAVALSSCADDSGNNSPKPAMKQVAHTNPITGQTTYSYEPADGQ